jgi:hypothetical protein
LKLKSCNLGLKSNNVMPRQHVIGYVTKGSVNSLQVHLSDGSGQDNVILVQTALQYKR